MEFELENGIASDRRASVSTSLSEPFGAADPFAAVTAMISPRSTADKRRGSLAGGAGLSVAETALSVGRSSSIDGTYSTRRGSRRQSRRGSVCSQPIVAPRVPVRIDAVASRIDDAGEGTIVEWPWDQAPVPRFANVLLNEAELRERYGARLQPFEPHFDASSSEGGSVRSLSPRTSHQQVINQQPKIKSNKDLVDHVRKAQKVLRRRLRDEALRNRCVTLVTQWKSRLVDTTSRLKDDTYSSFDLSLDPAHLHQEAMRDILEQEREIAEQLIVTFQKMARGAQELRQQREREEQEELHRLSMERQPIPQMVHNADDDKMIVGILDGLTEHNAFRGHEPRLPLTERIGRVRSRTERTVNIDETPVQCTVSSRGQGMPNVSSDATDKLQLLLPNTARALPKDDKQRQTSSSIAKRSVSPSTEAAASKKGATKPTPWAEALASIEILPNGFESASPPAQRVAPAVSKSNPISPPVRTNVNELVKAMVNAAAESSEKLTTTRRGSMLWDPAKAPHAGRRKSHVASLADAPPDFDALPDDPCEWRVVTNPTVMSQMHEILVTFAKERVGVIAGESLCCPVTGRIMLDPVVLTSDVIGNIGNVSAGETPSSAPPKVTLERGVWLQLEPLWQRGNVDVARLPQDLRDVLVSATDFHVPVHVRADMDALRSIVAWRSTMLGAFIDDAVAQRRHQDTAAWNATAELLVKQSKSTPPPAALGQAPTAAAAPPRGRFPIDIRSLQLAALDASRSLMDLQASLSELRAAASRLGGMVSTKLMKRGCFERDFTRTLVRMRALAGMSRDTAAPELMELQQAFDNQMASLAELDQSIDESAAALLGVERAFSFQRSQLVKAVQTIEHFNQRVTTYNQFMVAQREIYGPVYKASIAACYSVVKPLFEREMESTAANRQTINHVAAFLGEPSARSMMAHLPEHLLSLEAKLKQCRMLPEVLPLHDAVFLLLSRDGTMEDTLPFEPLPHMASVPLSQEGPLLPMQDHNVQAGIDMFRRKSLLMTKDALPPSPRRGGGKVLSPTAAQRHVKDEEGSHPSSVVVRPAGSDLRIPFWHFVRKNGAPLHAATGAMEPVAAIESGANGFLANESVHARRTQQCKAMQQSSQSKLVEASSARIERLPSIFKGRAVPLSSR